MSTIRATALMHQYTPGSNTSGPNRPPSLKRRAVALAFSVRRR